VKAILQLTWISERERCCVDVWRATMKMQSRSRSGVSGWKRTIGSSGTRTTTTISGEMPSFQQLASVGSYNAIKRLRREH